jgi:hypothetical protein
MALPSSFLAGKTLADILTGDVTIDLNDTNSGRFRSSLWVDSWAGSVTVETTTAAYGSSPWNANEVAWTGYTAGGGTDGYLTAPIVSSSSGTRAVAWSDSVSSLTWSGLSGAGSARGLLICHHNGSAYTRPLLFVNFGADFAHSSGAFEVEWDPTGGIMAFTY